MSHRTMRTLAELLISDSENLGLRIKIAVIVSVLQSHLDYMS